MRSGTPNGLSDTELVERFAARRDPNDPAAELAFATLLARHGAMVMRVCRAALHDQHESDDAFQATFLVLALRAPSIRRGDSLAAWLHGVALRVSANARSRAIRRQRHERRFAEMTRQTTSPACGHRALSHEYEGILHEEIGRLPKRFRTAVVMCYLEGKTHEMAAEHSGCPVGTIKSRLATAREKLRRQLTRRGVAPASVLLGLRGSGAAGITEPAALTSYGVSSCLVEATLRGALRIGTGQTALAGIVSAEAVALAQGVMKTMPIAKLSLMAVVVVSGLAATGAGLAAYHGLGRERPRSDNALGLIDPVQNGSQQKKAGDPADPAKGSQPAVPGLNQSTAQQKMAREAEDRVKTLVREFEADQLEFRKIARTAQNVEEAKKLMRSRRGADPSFYAGGLLHIAEAFPGTPAAEEGLIWIVTHLVYGTITERAKEMIARDHARSDKVETLLNSVQVRMAGSKPTERLFRAVLAQNANRRVKGFACFYLARYLDYQASFVRLEQLLAPAQLRNMPHMNEGWGDDYQDRLRKMDAETLEREAAPLYERVIKEFADLPIKNPGEESGLPGRPTNLGAAAAMYLDELKHLTVGQRAPEIEGIDLDGKPMRLSDYRGKVVALFFGVVDGSRGFQLQAPMRATAKRLTNESFVLLGVTTTPLQKAPSPDRDSLKKVIHADNLPIRFWYDVAPNGEPGPIQRAWNARFVTYLVDHRGVIRYKYLTRPEFFENGAAILMKALADEKARSKKGK
jgi:RNA polymerase sigma factor (sigma-70 family)